VAAYNAKNTEPFLTAVLNFFNGEKYSYVKFIPLAEVPLNLYTDVFKVSKVYIDFGAFAGRENKTQEAVLFDICVITGKRGAAKYTRDIPVPEKYKFETVPENVPAAANLILECINNYDENIGDFTEYKNFSAGFERKFEKSVQEIFVKTKGNR
jgi:hypothetical protein